MYAWKNKPEYYDIMNSGAKTGVIISFKTGTSFVDDTGIDDSSVRRFKPVVSCRPGPIKVWDVEIVG